MHCPPAGKGEPLKVPARQTRPLRSVRAYPRLVLERWPRYGCMNRMRSALPHPRLMSTIANARSSGSRELQSAAEPIRAPARKSSASPASDSSPALSRAKATGGSRPRSTEKLSAGRSAEHRSPGLGRSRRLEPSTTAAAEAKTAAISIGVKISGASPKRSKPLSPKPTAKAAYQSVNMSGRRITSSQGVRMAERPRTGSRHPRSARFAQ